MSTKINLFGWIVRIDAFVLTTQVTMADELRPKGTTVTKKNFLLGQLQEHFTSMQESLRGRMTIIQIFNHYVQETMESKSVASNSVNLRISSHNNNFAPVIPTPDSRLGMIHHSF